MEHIGEREIWHYLWGYKIPLGGIDILTIISTLVVIAVLAILMRLATRRLAEVPGRGQMMLELLVGAFDDLVASSLELIPREKNRRYLPLVFSLFTFLLMSNFIAVLPIEGIEEPTADINCTLALGIMSVSFAMYSGFRAKGILHHLEELCGPMFHEPGIAAKLSALFFFPLDSTGELSKIVSISFRLFGNILGGSIILVVISNLVYQMFLPIPMDFFFIFFVGTVQAFVFTMLTLTYIAIALK